MASAPSNGRPSRRRQAVVGLAAAGLLVGCGGSSKAAGPGPGGSAPRAADSVLPLPADQPQRGACGLVTQAEVEAAVGSKVAPGKEETQPSRSLCSFTLASAPDQSVVVISTTSSGVPAFFDAARQRAGSAQTVTAGDQAFVAGAQGLVRKGNTMVAILVVLRQQATQLASAATRLTQAVGSRL